LFIICNDMWNSGLLNAYVKASYGWKLAKEPPISIPGLCGKGPLCRSASTRQGN
jgi:hypothetical protein